MTTEATNLKKEEYYDQRTKKRSSDTRSNESEERRVLQLENEKIGVPTTEATNLKILKKG